MGSSTVLQFDFNGQLLRFPASATASVTSPFTKRDLQRLETVLTVSHEDADRIREFLGIATMTDSDGSLWSAKLDMEAYTDDGPHSLTITFSESERLHADRVEFEGLSLTPTATRYEEHLNQDGSIGITFQSILTKEETDRLRSLHSAIGPEARYWPVIRRGITDEPRRMRLGRVIWQPLHNGTIGHDITLVDEAFDTTEGSSALLGLAGEPQVGNLIGQVSELLVQFEVLLAELRAAGAVGPEAIERVRASASTLGAARHHIFFEVADLSRW